MLPIVSENGGLAEPPAKRHKVEADSKRKLSSSHEKRSKNRAEAILLHGYKVSQHSLNRYLGPAAPVETSFRTEALPVANGARTALLRPKPERPDEKVDIEALQRNDGFQYVKWNGRYAASLPVGYANHPQKTQAYR